MRPGALWLARASGYPLIPMGFAARPALRWLRWDHQITPLPGSRIAVIIGSLIQIGRKQEINDSLRAELGAAIDRLTQRAWRELMAPLASSFFQPRPRFHAAARKILVNS